MQAKLSLTNKQALVLRGIFTLRREELLWFYQSGASFVYPDAWGAFWMPPSGTRMSLSRMSFSPHKQAAEKYVAPIPEAERHDFLNAYMRRLTSDDVDVRRGTNCSEQLSPPLLMAPRMACRSC